MENHVLSYAKAVVPNLSAVSLRYRPQDALTRPFAIAYTLEDGRWCEMYTDTSFRELTSGWGGPGTFGLPFHDKMKAQHLEVLEQMSMNKCKM